MKVVVRWSGEIDVATIAEGRAAIEGALADRATTAIVLDLSQVTFFGSTALDAVAQLAGSAADRGVGFELHDVPVRVRKVFEITDTLNLLGPSPQQGPDERR